MLWSSGISDGKKFGITGRSPSDEAEIVVERRGEADSYLL